MMTPQQGDRRVSFNHETNLWEECVGDFLVHKYWTAKAALQLTARHMTTADSHRADL